MTIGPNSALYSDYDALNTMRNGANSSVQSGMLETSNVDLTQTAANQITEQTAVEANAQSVQTADSMMQSVLDIMA